MTTPESSVLHQNHHHSHYPWLRFGMKMPLAILISLFLLVAIWYTAPSIVSPTRLSPAQLDAFLSSPAVLEAQKPPNAPPQPFLATITPEEFQQSANSQFNNASSSAGDTLQSSSEFNDTSQQVPQGQGQAPLSSTEIIFNSSSTNSNLSTVFDELEVDPLNPEPLSPIASRWNSDTGTSNYDFGPSPSPGFEPGLETKFIPVSNVSALLQYSNTEVDVNREQEDEDIELYTIAMGPAQDSVKNETFLSPAPSPTYRDEDLLEPEPEQSEERYMFPMLSSFVGTGNQLIEYKSAAVIARTLSRTLCLVPFFGGPPRHSGYLGTNDYGVHIEDRYSLKELSRFVKLANISECVQQCNGTIDRVWRLRSCRSSNWSRWFPRINWEGLVNFDRRFGKWSSPADIASAFGQLNEEPEAKCVGLGGAHPGLRWRGGIWAASAYIVHTENIMNATNKFQARALGTKPYISVHWRFEETFCRGHRLGLCFLRCRDGALIGGGLKSPRYMDLPTMMGASHAGVGFTKEDVAAALYDKANEVGVGSVYLSTDGWLRGNESMADVKWVVEEIRRRGLKVSGLWKIAGLPNFSDGNYVLSEQMPLLFGLQGVKKVSNTMIALVEQEICVRSVVFLGSGQSSWTLAVFDSRQSRRRRLDIEESVKRNMTGSPPLTEQDVDEVVIGDLHKDKHAAGPSCPHSSRGFIMVGTPETYEDEAPDGWLDYEACEKRIDLGGKCLRLVTGITK